MLYDFDIFSCFSFALLSLSLILVILSVIFELQEKSNLEKLTPYECGFSPFNATRDTYNIHFYVVAVLFLVFDVEITLLFPIMFSITVFNSFIFWNIFLLLVILFFGFLIEWKFLQLLNSKHFT
jgi:NADH:ubiquinone oxidoreductase subunit 3 (subunit A)